MARPDMVPVPGIPCRHQIHCIRMCSNNRTIDRLVRAMDTIILLSRRWEVEMRLGGIIERRRYHENTMCTYQSDS